MEKSSTLAGFPSDFTHPYTKKSKEYILQYAKAIYAQKTQTTWDEQLERIIVNRKYAEGLQSVSKYKNLMGIEEGDTSYLNIDWSVVPITSKFVDLRVGEMINENNKATATAIDPVSKSKKDDERNKYLANMMLKKYSDMIESATGMPLVPEGEYIPESEEELDLQMQLNIKQATEIGGEILINWELYQKDWKKIKKKIAKDLIVIKKGAAKLYFDENKMIRIRYADWANLILPYSVQEDLSDINYVGEIIKVPLHQLRKMSELSEDDLFEIAKRSAGSNGNRVWKYGHSFHQYYEKNQRTEYDDFLIDVLDFNFVSINTNKYEKKNNNYEGYYFQPKPHNYEVPKEKKDRKLITKDLEFTYKGQWIIDTEYLINYGLTDDILRERKNSKLSPKAPLPYIFIAPDIYDMENKSTVERIRPHDDKIQIIHKKMQVLLAKLKPPGTAVDVDALSGVFLGQGGSQVDGSWGPLQLQDLAEQTGYHYYSGKDEEGRPMNRRPIEDMPHNMGTAFQELIALYNFEIQQIRDVTGLNEIRDSSLPDKESGLGIQRLAMQASRNTTRPIDYAFDDIHEDIAKRVSMMLQFNISKKRNKDVYENIVGKEMYKSLEAGINHLEYDIKIEAGPDDQDKMLLETNIQKSIDAKELRIEDGIMVRNIPNIKLANQYLTLRRKQYAKERMDENAQQIKIQMQEANQAALIKQQGEQQTIQIETAGKKELLQVEYILKDAFAQKEHLRTMEELKLQGDIKSGQIGLTADREFQHTALTSTTA